MPDYSEVIELQERRAKEKPHGGIMPEMMAAHQRMQRTVALRMEELVTVDPWETYQAHLERLLAEDRSVLQAKETTIIEGEVVGDELMKQLLVIQRIRGRIQARQEDLELPKVLISLAPKESA